MKGWDLLNSNDPFDNLNKINGFLNPFYPFIQQSSRAMRHILNRIQQPTLSVDMTTTWIVVSRLMMAMTQRSRWSRLHSLRVVHGSRSSILCMPPKIQIMELDKVLVKFI